MRLHLVIPPEYQRIAMMQTFSGKFCYTLAMNTLRKTIQTVFLLAAFTLLVRHLLGLTFATVESYCPGGALEILPYYLKHQVFLCSTSTYNMSMFLALVVGTVIAGRAFCSWVCPIGTTMEFLENQGRTIKTVMMGVWNVRLAVLGRLRYVALAVVLVFTFREADLVLRPFCPNYAMLGGEGHEVAWWSKWLILAFVVAALYLPFFWCRVLCPLGAMLGLLKKASPLAPTIDARVCTSCRACERACPQQIPILEQKRVSSSDCTQCLVCTESCPVDCLRLGVGYGVSMTGSNSGPSVAPRGIIPVVAIFLVLGGFLHAWYHPFPSYVKNWPSQQPPKATDRIEMVLKGLRCRGTCGVLAKHLASETGVLSVKAYTNEHRALIEFDSSLTSKEKIRERIGKTPFVILEERP